MSARSIKLTPLLIATIVLGLVCLFQALSGRFFLFNLVQRLEWASYDWRVRLATHFPQTNAPNLGVVFLDDDSLTELGEGKLLDNQSYGLLWPRHIYGRLVRALSAQGAKLVAMDVLFGELRPDHADIELPDKTRIGSDAFFAEQLRAAGNVVLAADADVVPAELFRTNAFAIGDIPNQADPDGIMRQVPAFQTYYAWNPLFRNARRQYHKKLVLEPRQVRFLNPVTEEPELTIPIDEEGFFKLEDLTGKKEPGISRLLPAYTKIRAWHMGIVMAARELKLDLKDPTLEPGRIVLHGPGVERVIPVDAQGRFYVNWSLPLESPRLIKANIEHVLLQDKLRIQGESVGLTNLFRNALVTVGSCATGNNLVDMGATPLSSRTLLLSTHWNVANMIITDRCIKVVSRFDTQALILVLGFLSALLTWRMRSAWASVWIGAIFVGYVAAGVLLFVRFRYWLPLTSPLGGGLLLTHLCMTTYRAVFEAREQRRVKRMFSKIVSPNVVQELLRAEQLSLGGERRRLTVFFCDVRGFTELSDLNQARAEEYVRQHKLSLAEAEHHFNEQARQLLEAVNLYLSLVADTVKEHGGTLDKYIGDCVMAFWGAPTPNEQHALDCVHAAIQVQRSVDAVNQERAEENRRRELENQTREAQGECPRPLLDLLYLGCGINTGVVTVGLMGSDAHLVNYTVFGREVNVASRLEGVSGRSRIIIGEGTYQEIHRDDPALAAACIELPAVTVKGIRTPVKIFEVPWKTGAGRQLEGLAPGWRNRFTATLSETVPLWVWLPGPF